MHRGALPDHVETLTIPHASLWAVRPVGAVFKSVHYIQFCKRTFGSYLPYKYQLQIRRFSGAPNFLFDVFADTSSVTVESHVGTATTAPFPAIIPRSFLKRKKIQRTGVII